MSPRRLQRPRRPECLANALRAPRAPLAVCSFAVFFTVALAIAFVFVSVFSLAPAHAKAPAPRAALIVGAPLPPSPAALSVTRGRLADAYRLSDDAALTRELESLDRDPTPERLVQDALRDAQQRMRRLALTEVQRVLADAEPQVQRLPPSQSGRALLIAVAVRKAQVALLQSDTAAAEAELSRALSVDPDFSLDQAQEAPPLLLLFEKVRTERGRAGSAALRVETTPPGAQVVLRGLSRGPAPMQVVETAGPAVVWAVLDGHQPRNVTVVLTPNATTPLSVQIQLERTPKATEARPLVEALREAPPSLRPEIARPLLPLLNVDAIILAQAGAGGRPSLWAYGAPPAASLTGPGLPFDITFTRPPTAPRRVRPFTIAALAASAGLVVGGVLTGVLVGVLR